VSQEPGNESANQTRPGIAAIERRGADVAAPHWLAQLVKAKGKPIDWMRCARAGASVGAPIALGVIFGQTGLGALAALGGLCGTYAAASGAYRDRARRMTMVISAGATGFFLGALTAGHPYWSAGLVIMIAAVSALISSGGNNASLAGLQLLVNGLLGSAQPTAVHPLIALACFATGGAWSLLLAIGAWPVRATAPERRMVSAVYDELATMLDAIGTPRVYDERGKLTTALNTAYDALLTARSRLQGRDETYRRLLVLLTETTPVVEATVALANARHRPPRTLINAVSAAASTIATDGSPPEITFPERGSPRILALTNALRQVFELLDGRDVWEPVRTQRPHIGRRLITWASNAIGGPAAWLFALRLVICIAIAEALAIGLHLERSYWVPLTVAIVLKPDFGSVFARAVLRGGGTVVGVVLGTLVLATQLDRVILVALVVLIAAALPIGQIRNYGMFSTFVTPLVIVLQDITHPGDWSVVAARLLDTVLGCAIVLVVGYLLWPGSRKPKVGGTLAAVIDDLARYADRALSTEPGGRSALRRRTYRSLSDLRTQFQRLITEPSAAGRQVEAWWPVMVGLERATDAVTRLAVDVKSGATEPPPEGDVRAIVAAIGALGAEVRNEPSLPNSPLPENPQLRAISNELASVRRSLRGPNLDERGMLAVVRRWFPLPRHD
jgi:uncharacterized membrane protein YccC